MFKKGILRIFIAVMICSMILAGCSNSNVGEKEVSTKDDSFWITGTKTVPTAWSNAEYDKLINEANQSIDKELRAENSVKAENILLKEDATIIPYAYSESNTFSHKYLKNLMEPSFSAIILKNAYIDK